MDSVLLDIDAVLFWHTINDVICFRFLLNFQDHASYDGTFVCSNWCSAGIGYLCKKVKIILNVLGACYT